MEEPLYKWDKNLYQGPHQVPWGTAVGAQCGRKREKG